MKTSNSFALGIIWEKEIKFNSHVLIEKENMVEKLKFRIIKCLKNNNFPMKAKSIADFINRSGPPYVDKHTVNRCLYSKVMEVIVKKDNKFRWEIINSVNEVKECENVINNLSTPLSNIPPIDNIINVRADMCSKHNNLVDRIETEELLVENDINESNVLINAGKNENNLNNNIQLDKAINNNDMGIVYAPVSNKNEYNIKMICRLDIKKLKVTIGDLLKDQLFFIMVGVPGSGKTTWIRKFLPKSVIRINPERIRTVVYGFQQRERLDYKKEEIVWMEVFGRIYRIRDSKDSFVLDSTAISKNRRIELLNSIKHKNGIKKVAVFIDVSITTAYSWNSKRKKYVPEHVIDKFYRQLQRPNINEGFDYILNILYEDKVFELYERHNL